MTYRHHCARSLVCLRENERERVTKKTRGRERGRERQERDSGVPGTTDEEGTILIGRMRGWERMLVGGEGDRV